MSYITEEFILGELNKMVAQRKKKQEYEEPKPVKKKIVSPVAKKIIGSERYKFNRPPIDERVVYPRDKLVRVVEIVTRVPSSSFMSSKRRNYGMIVPRHLISWMLMMHTAMSMEQIGFFTNRKDHSSVVNSFNVVYENPEIFNPLKERVYDELKSGKEEASWTPLLPE